MRIVMAGASGLLGTRLRERLAVAGHDVVRLVRRVPAGADERRWDPAAGRLDPATLADAGAVINLAGAGVGDRRWSPAYKRELTRSRVGPTTTIADAIAALPEQQRPAALLNASAIGFYGHPGEARVDETSPAGTGFFPALCQAWEDSTRAAAAAGTRVVLLRTGLVLTATGGLLGPMRLTTRLGVGGPLAGGRWWMSWISIDDWIAAVLFLAERASVAGPVNLVGPTPVRNADFARALGRALHRPALVPTPGFGLRVALGEFSTEAVASIRVVPRVLLDAGFPFQHTDLDAALGAVLRG